MLCVVAVCIGFIVYLKADFWSREEQLTGLKFKGEVLFESHDKGRDGYSVWIERIPDIVLSQMRAISYQLERYPKNCALENDGYRLVRWTACSKISSETQRRLQYILIHESDDKLSVAGNVEDIKTIGDARVFASQLMQTKGNFYSYFFKESDFAGTTGVFFYLIDFDKALLLMIAVKT